MHNLTGFTKQEIQAMAPSQQPLAVLNEPTIIQATPRQTNAVPDSLRRLVRCSCTFQHKDSSKMPGVSNVSKLSMSVADISLKYEHCQVKHLTSLDAIKTRSSVCP